MRWMVLAMLTFLVPGVSGQAIDPILMLDPRTRPVNIDSKDLVDFDSLSLERRSLIAGALAVVKNSPWLPYLVGGAEPGRGGFDCSGAMYFVMRKAGLDPPRSSGGQMEWLKKNGRLHEVSADAVDLKHPSLAALKPGDLLFWAVEETPGVPRVHHVAMYLGTEKIDGRPVLINSSDGRSYRGQKGNGYGVYDFRVPTPQSLSKLVGYGSPPGLGQE